MAPTARVGLKRRDTRNCLFSPMGWMSHKGRNHETRLLRGAPVGDRFGLPVCDCIGCKNEATNEAVPLS